ncbi:MAG: hypothetical protein BWK77_00865, partial [Verrucomicrobia bacterium A1]
MRILPISLLALALLGPALATAQEPATEPRIVEESLDVSRSSWIKGATFTRAADAARGRLTVRMGDGEITYTEVPVTVWAAFRDADSLGRFYTEQIKNRYERES